MKRELAPEGSGRPYSRIACLAVAATFALAGAAFAITTGLQNGSFEDDLSGWSASTLREGVYNREVVYGPGGSNGETVPCDSTPYGICVVGEDRFSVRDEVYNEATGDFDPSEREIVVTPNHGAKMLRLGGPFLDSDTGQAQHIFQVKQQFVVDPAQPILQLRFNAFTWDYEGFDQLEFKVRITDENGNVIARTVQGAFGDDVSLKTTGWLPANIDLTGYENQQVLLEIESGGTADELYGFWAYIDQGFSAGDPTPDPVVDPPNFPGTNNEVPVYSQENGNGEVWFQVGSSSVAQFPGGCMPLGITVPISPGTGAVSNVTLILRPQLPGQPAQPDIPFPMSQVAGTNNWQTTINCVKTGGLFLQYDLTEDGATQTFVIPIGGITLIDPQGVVYDRADYDAALAAHGDTDATATPAEKAAARADAAISGATVRLQRFVSGGFVNVLSGDPGISPKVNPETTGADGLYQWDVVAGKYRVVVSKDGYLPVTSAGVDIPPPVLDLHIPMERQAPNLPNTDITAGPANGSTTADSTPTFEFTSPGNPAATFECRVDGSGSTGWAACTSPHTTAALANGSHTFEVRAVTGAGADASPAERTFTVAVTDTGGGGNTGGDTGGTPAAPADSDGDGIADANDACPTQGGMPPNGCPPASAPNDSDGDGVVDGSDECPSVPGPGTTGCPPPANSPKPPCFGLSGKRRATCLWLKKQEAACAKKYKGKKNAKKRRLCVKRARALAKCQSLKKGSKARKQCVTKAKKIGAPRKKKG